MKVTYEMLRDNPDLVDALHAQARRERSAAMHRLVIAPLKAALRADRTSPAPRALKYHRA
jgi:hypothetical protein